MYLLSPRFQEKTVLKISALIIPVLIIALIVFARFRGVKLYDALTEGIKGAIPLALSLFPYLAAIFIMTELFEVSGLAGWLNRLLSPMWKLLGIPTELGSLILIKPFSGSGSLAVLSEIFARHGADSYISRCAGVIFGCSETVFYVSAVYFTSCKNKNLFLPIAITLISTFISAILACLICKVL